MSDSTSSGKRLRVSPSLVISIFALVIAMSSGAYAAVTIAAKNSVVSSSIKNHNVKTADLKKGAVKKAILASNSVDGTKIVDGSIGASDFSSTALANYYTKAQSDTNYYTKAQSDAKYAPLPGLIRGVSMQSIVATAPGQEAGDNISYGGYTLSAPPTAHYIKIGDPVPAGCSGTAAAPNAAPGNLCVFEVFSSNNTGNQLLGPSGTGAPTAFGGVVFAHSTAAGEMVITTAWAVRPLALAPPSAPAARVGTNAGRTGGSFGH